MYTTNFIALIGLGVLTSISSFDFDSNVITSTLGFYGGTLAALSGVAGLIFFNSKK